MKIIGHRGATGLALENTIEAINAGLKAGVDIVEFDIRQTKDLKIVLNHDPDLRRTYGVDLSIKKCTLRQLRTPCPKLPTLADALKVLNNKTAIIELKEFIEPGQLYKITQKYPNVSIRYASFNHRAIRAIKKYDPNSFCYILEHHSPFEIINKTKKMKANGIGINYGLINPLTYFLAKRNNLDIYVYTLNSLWIAKIFKIIYKNIAICTDMPNKIRKVIK